MEPRRVVRNNRRRHRRRAFDGIEDRRAGADDLPLVIGRVRDRAELGPGSEAIVTSAPSHVALEATRREDALYDPRRRFIVAVRRLCDVCAGLS
jgi:hypothetical protein